MTSSVWNRHTILAELRSRGMTLAGISERYGVNLSGVKNIWTRPHQPAERAISDFLGEPVEKLFPDRYPKRRNHILKPDYQSQPSRGKPVSPREAA